MTISRESEGQSELRGFDPYESERLLREACPAFDAALTRAEGKKEEFFGAAVRYILEVKQEVSVMHVAGRFRTDKRPNHEDYGMDHGNGMVNPMLRGLSEAEFKRAQLDGDLQTLVGEIMIVAEKFKGVILDIEATKTEG